MSQFGFKIIPRTHPACLENSAVGQFGKNISLDKIELPFYFRKKALKYNLTLCGMHPFNDAQREFTPFSFSTEMEDRI